MKSPGFYTILHDGEKLQYETFCEHFYSTHLLLSRRVFINSFHFLYCLKMKKKNNFKALNLFFIFECILFDSTVAIIAYI